MAPAPARQLVSDIASARVFASGRTYEISLVGNTLVRFIRALDAILPFAAVRWKQLRDFVRAARSRITSGAVPQIDGLADLKPMIAQLVPRVAKRARPA